MATPGLVFSQSSAVGSTNNFTTLKINIPPTLSGNCLVLEVSCADSGVNPTISDNKSNANWAVATSVVASGSSRRHIALVCTNAAAGTTLLTLVWSVATNAVRFDFSEWNNVSQASVATALDGTSTATNISSGNSVPAGAIVTTVDSDLILQWGENSGNVDNSTTFTKGSGFTKLRSGIDGTFRGSQPTSLSQYQVQGTHGSINPTYTYSGTLNTSHTVAIALKPAAAGTPPDTSTQL